MDVQAAILQFSQPWKKERWIENKRKIQDCVDVQGALLEHPDGEHIYFAPEPAHFSVVYEILKNDIIEVLPTGLVISKFGIDYPIARIYLNDRATAMRLQTCSAYQLVEDCREFRSSVMNGDAGERTNVEGSFVVAGPNGSHPIDPPDRPEPRPSSSPSERPHERTRPEKNPAPVSGIRG
jgi:hypothetical protein